MTDFAPWRTLRSIPGSLFVSAIQHVKYSLAFRNRKRGDVIHRRRYGSFPNIVMLSSNDWKLSNSPCTNKLLCIVLSGISHKIIIEINSLKNPCFAAERFRFFTNFLLFCLIAYLSIPVVSNLVSRRQAMNRSFDSLRIVNTYGAFGRYAVSCYSLYVFTIYDTYIYICCVYG